MLNLAEKEERDTGSSRKRMRSEKTLLGDTLGWMDGLITNFQLWGLRARLPRRKEKEHDFETELPRSTTVGRDLRSRDSLEGIVRSEKLRKWDGKGKESLSAHLNCIGGSGVRFTLEQRLCVCVSQEGCQKGVAECWEQDLGPSGSSEEHPCRLCWI